MAVFASLPGLSLLAATNGPAADGAPAAKAPGQFANYPVDSVPWDGAVEFCRRLSDLPEEKKAGRVYRLPTEAEWEYACRAGTTTPFNMDDLTLGKDDANVGNRGTMPVGSYRSNALGLCDMHGNVWEWCEDLYVRDFYAVSPTTDPKRSQLGSAERVIRGGSFCDPQVACRSAFRGHAQNVATDGAPFGFRVACDVTPADEKP